VPQIAFGLFEKNRRSGRCDIFTRGPRAFHGYVGACDPVEEIPATRTRSKDSELVCSQNTVKSFTSVTIGEL
jgi:hypothetical protein